MEIFNSASAFAKTIPHLFLWGVATGIVGVGMVAFLLRWARSIVILTLIILAFVLFK